MTEAPNMKAIWELVALDHREDLAENAADDFQAEYGRRKKLCSEIQSLIDSGHIGEDMQGRPLIIDYAEKPDRTLIIDAIKDGDRVRIFIRNNKTIKIMNSEQLAAAAEQERMARTGPPTPEEKVAGRTPERARRRMSI